MTSTLVVYGARRAYIKASYHPGQLGLARRTAWVRTYAATGPPPPTEGVSSSNTPNPPEIPSSNPSRPRKVELRPGPIKKPIATPSPASSPSSPSSSADAQPAPSTSTSTESESTTSPPSSSTSENPLSSLIPPNSETARILACAQADLRASESAGVLKPPPADASKFGKLWHQAKELFKFYYSGIKMQWTHHKMVNDIKARVKAEKAQGIDRGVTRWESQFMRTHQKDLAKLVPFVLILVIIEEILPLIVIYAPFMLPSTTILPSQAERIYTKREEKKTQTLTTVKWYADIEKLDSSALRTLDVKSLSNDLAWTVCRAFDLSDRGPRALVNRRLAKHLTYLASDDALLAREAPNALLTLNELRNALSERGQLTQGASHDELQQRLDSWLQNVKSQSDILGAFFQYAMTVEASSPKKSE